MKFHRRHYPMTAYREAFGLHLIRLEDEREYRAFEREQLQREELYMIQYRQAMIAQLRKDVEKGMLGLDEARSMILPGGAVLHHLPPKAPPKKCPGCPRCTNPLNGD